MVVFNFAVSCGVGTWIERRPSCLVNIFGPSNWPRNLAKEFGQEIWPNGGLFVGSQFDRVLVDIQMILTD